MGRSFEITPGHQSIACHLKAHKREVEHPGSATLGIVLMDDRSAPHLALTDINLPMGFFLIMQFFFCKIDIGRSLYTG